MDHHRVVNRRRLRRSRHVRRRIQGTTAKPRLTVFRSHKHIYAQLIDDLSGKTLASASTRDKEVVSSVKEGSKKDAATVVGKTLAKRATASGISRVAFDRGPYKYHGRIAALADGAREAGLKF